MTDTQKEMVVGSIRTDLSTLFPDHFDREAVVDAIKDDVIKDIEETADWSELLDDEIYSTDVSISVARVIMERIRVTA